MQLNISHTTHYRYDEPVVYALQRARLVPSDTPQQRVVEWDLQITGGKAEAAYRDHHGNQTEFLSLSPGTTEISITANGVVETTDTAGVLGHITGPAPMWLYQQQTSLTEPGSGIQAIADKITGSDNPLDKLHALSDHIRERVSYTPGETHAAATAEEAVAGGHGVCQDHTHIFLSAARLMGIPARYVSGYMMMNDRDEQEASHAWAEAHLPDLGWVGFDISNGYSPDERYVRLAIGRDYSEAAPLTGLRHGTGDESMIVSLQVQQ